MSSITTTFDLPQAGPLPTRRAPLSEVRFGLRPWGFWGSLLWGLLALATGLLAATIYTVIWMLTHQLRTPSPEDISYATAAGMVASVVPLAVLFIAAKIRRFALSDYFALNGFSRRDLILGTVCLAVLIVVFGAMGPLFGIDDGSKYVEETYRAAKLAGIMPMLWLAVVVVAPVTEELLFRGFLHRSWAPSWLGSSGTIILTSALWAALHQQYDSIGILAIFLMGLMLGWLRQRSGSTALTIVLHAFNNLFAMIMVTLQVEWLS